MQSPLETSDTKVWTEEELKELIEYTQYLRMQNEDLQAKMIAMDAYVKNADAKVKRLTLLLKQYNIL